MSNDDLAVRIRVLDARTAVLESEKVQRSLRKIGRDGRKGGEEATVGMASMERAAHRTRHVIGQLAGLAGIGGLVFGIHDAVHAATQWQASQSQLQNALKNTGIATSANMKLLEDSARQTSTHGGFKAQEETQGLSQFVRLTHSATKAIGLNKEATLLARGANLSYSQAVRMVSQIQTGNTGRLQRWIGVLQPSTYYTRSLTAEQKRLNPELYRHAQLLDKQATAAEANRRVMDKFRNATTAYSRTAAGALQNAEHSFELLAEEIGTVLLPYVADLAQWLAKDAQVVVEHWPQIRREISKVTGEVKDVVGWFGRHRDATRAAEAGLVVLVGGYLAYTAAVKVATAIQAAFNLVMALNPIELTVIAIAALTAGVIYCYYHFKTFRNVVDSVFGWLRKTVPPLVNFVAKHWRLLTLPMTAPFQAAWFVIQKIIGGIRWIAHNAGHIHIPHLGVHLPGGIHFATGGMVPSYFAGGGLAGPRGTDTVPAWLTPGEGVLTRRAVAAIGGPSGVAALNNGGGSFGGQEIVMPIKLVMADNGLRVIAEGVGRYQLKRAARA